MFNFIRTASAGAFGVPEFFKPRRPPPYIALEGSVGALSCYDTRPLRATLGELVDFDLISRKAVRLSPGAAISQMAGTLRLDVRQTIVGWMDSDT
jgi:NTE family protein